MRWAWMALLLAAPSAAEMPRTLRLDYYHTGDAETEIFSLHRTVEEPLPWPGNPDRPLDDTGRGRYLFEVEDAASGEPLYSRGYDSIFGEWQTTAEARAARRTFSESLRFPEPAQPVRVHVSRRDPDNRFRRVWSVEVDPADVRVQRAHAPAPGRVHALHESGEPAHRLDLLILGDGYTAAEEEKFLSDARRLSDALLSAAPFSEHRDAFNVRALMAPVPESGVPRPSSGLQRYSPLGTTYDAFGSERYVLAFDNLALRTIASSAPYEAIEILVNGETYGGGGIFGQFATAAAGNEWADYLVIHEFAHHLAALADEYYTSPVAYEPAGARVEPWEPNVTALLDPDRLKWRDLVEADTPLPTPWPKQEFERYFREHQERRARLRAEGRPEAEMNALFREAQAFAEGLFADQPYRDRIGAFEGASYEATGLYRPAMNCVMFTRHDRFCDVCAAAIVEIIELYTGR